MQNVNVLKSSLAVPQHLFAGLSEIFNTSKPGLSWVFTPSISKHIIPAGTFPRLYALGLDARAFPLFSFNPDRVGNVLSSKLNIDGNPQGERTWMQSDLSFVENGEEKTMSYTLSWADWAYTLKSWHEKFEPHADTMGKPVIVAEYVLLPKVERMGKSPVIYRIDHGGELKKYRVDDDVVRATEACANAWLLLREISGELTAFPEKLQKKVEAELAVAYEQRMEESRRQYEQKMQNLEQEHLEKIRIKLKEKLMRLSQPVVK
jgi:pyruvate-ferredoxin/flavodoxin oxidoreductase